MNAPVAVPTSRARASGLVERYAPYVWSLLVSGLALAVADAMVMAGRAGVGPLIAARYALLTFVACAWLALLGGLAAGALAMLGRACVDALGARARASAAGPVLGWGLLIGGLTVMFIRSWDLPRDPFHFAISVPILCVAGAAALARLESLIGSRRLLWLGLALALVLFALDSTQYRGLYATLHRALAFLAWTVAAAVLFPSARTLPGALRAIPVVIALCAHVALPASDQTLALGVLHGSLQPKLIALLRTLADHDRDGYAAALGGGDCDDSEQSVHPDACEVRGNGRDDNCNGIEAAAPPRAGLPRTPRSPLPDIYIVVVDTLRADLGGARMPTLQALARKGLHFRRAYSAYPSTLNSVTAILRSRYPRYQDERAPDLFGMAIAAGYDARFWLATRRYMVALKPGSPHAIELPTFIHTKIDGKATWTQELVDDALAELELQPNAPPRLRWIQLFDVHEPFVHAPGAGSMRDNYAIEVGHVERQLARLTAAIERSERGRRAVLVVMADHGELLGEHGAYHHDSFLWEESIRVPLVMRLPGVEPRVIDQPASLIDVVPTLAAYLGFDSDPGFQGHDWLTHPERRNGHPIAQSFSVDLQGGLGRPARLALIGPRHKLLLNLTDNTVELYDLASDPGERLPLRPSHTPAASPLFAALAAWQDLPGCNARGSDR